MFELREGRLTIPPPKEGACRLCGEIHARQDPHNRNSLIYQHRFRMKHGWYPTWEDAMRHCGAKTKDKWIRKLEGKGIHVDLKEADGLTDGK
jgi:hypothetical protein